MSRTANRDRPPAQMVDWALETARLLVLAAAAAAWTYCIGAVVLRIAG